MKIKKIIALVLTAALIVCALAACAEKDDGKTLVLGFDAEYPPYGYMDDNGDYVGFDIDLAKEACSRLGWELELEPIDWNAKDSLLEAGEIDCIWNGFTINGRENDYAWTDPYMDNSIVFLVTKDSGFDTKADLAGAILEVQGGSSAADALYSEDEADFYATLSDVVEVKDYNTAVMDLESGAVDVVAIDIGVAAFQVEGRSDLYIMSETLVSEQYGIGFDLDDTETRDAVEKTLYEMLDDGAFMKIAAKWGLEDSVALGKN